jgi:ferrochelatase
MTTTRGVLLCNIGTPDSFSEKDVAKYLREFLMDEEILTIPFPLRYILVNAIIVPKRAALSAANYKAIWTEQGSPLRVLSEALRQTLQQSLDSSTGGSERKSIVAVGMRYGKPSIPKALAEFHAAGVSDVLVVPLYPQYARATTVSTLKQVAKVTAKQGYGFKIDELAPFYNDRGFIGAVAETVRAKLAGKQVDHYLMTYHGLPESQVKKNPGCLQSESCCQRAEACALNCYRAQCFKTSELIAQALGLQPDQWTVSFQSRLGKTEWIKPYTDETLKQLPGRGIKRLAVLCPSFVSDCLETLEEIGVQGAEAFRHAGGEEFYLVPCLNERADYLASLIDRT